MKFMILMRNKNRDTFFPSVESSHCHCFEPIQEPMLTHSFLKGLWLWLYIHKRHVSTKRSSMIYHRQQSKIMKSCLKTRPTQTATPIPCTSRNAMSSPSSRRSRLDKLMCRPIRSPLEKLCVETRSS